MHRLSTDGDHSIEISKWHQGQEWVATDKGIEFKFFYLLKRIEAGMYEFLTAVMSMNYAFEYWLNHMQQENETDSSKMIVVVHRSWVKDTVT